MSAVVASSLFWSKDSRRQQYYAWTYFAWTYFCIYDPVVCGKQSSDAYVHNIHNASGNCGKSGVILQAILVNNCCSQYCTWTYFHIYAPVVYKERTSCMRCAYSSRIYVTPHRLAVDVLPNPSVTSTTAPKPTITRLPHPKKSIEPSENVNIIHICTYSGCGCYGYKPASYIE